MAASTSTSTSSSTSVRQRRHSPSEDAVDLPPPEVFAVAGGLQLPLDLHRSRQVEPQSLEGGIVGRELADSPHGTPLKVPDVDSQHSRLR